MTRIPVYALAAVLLCGAAAADEISISLSADGSQTELGPRRDVRKARMAITTRDGSTTLFLIDGLLAVQLTDKALSNVKEDESAGFLEELLASGVRLAVGKAVQLPIANVREVEYRDGALHMTTTANKPVFAELKVNGTEVLRGFSPTDARRFVNAFRAEKTRAR